MPRPPAPPTRRRSGTGAGHGEIEPQTLPEVGQGLFFLFGLFHYVTTRGFYNVSTHGTSDPHTYKAHVSEYVTVLTERFPEVSPHSTAAPPAPPVLHARWATLAVRAEEASAAGP